MRRRVRLRSSAARGSFHGAVLAIGMIGATVLFLPSAVSAAAVPATSRLSPVPNPALVRTGPAAPVSEAAGAGSGRSWTQVNEITGASGGELGWSIAVNRGTLVVGAPSDNGGIGAAYVYTGSGTRWTEAAELTPTDGAANDFFGSAVAVKPGEIVVGAVCHSATSPSCEGAAYVFAGSGNTWTQQAELDDPGQATNDDFGSPLAFSGSSLLVGAPGESGSGAVFDYSSHHGRLTEASEVPDPASTAADEFGFDLAVHAKQMVVGAPGTTGNKGAAYVFDQVGGTWIEEATLTAGNGEGCSATCGSGPYYIFGDTFGAGVATRKGLVVVGAPGASYPTAEPDGVGPGTAYVFTGSGHSWTQQTELADPAEYTANNASPPGCNAYSSPCDALDEFGLQVALAGSNVVAAAPFDPQGFPNDGTGAAFVIPKVHGTLSNSNITKLMASDGEAGDQLGYAGLATIGKDIVIVGSPYSDDGGVYFFQS